jgi:SAM-dependent methyltransferase
MRSAFQKPNIAKLKSSPAKANPGGEPLSDAQRSGLMPGKWGIALLTALLRRPVISSIIVGLVAFVIAFFLIQLVNPPPHDAHDSWLERLRNETQTTVTALVIAVLIVPLTIALVLRKTFMALISIARSSAEKGRAPVLPFLAETIEQMDGQLHQLQGKGVVLESYEVANWVRRCFQTAGPSTRYLGTDSHVPSQYEDVYTDYLQAHSEILEKSSQGGHVRVMVVDIEKLRTDKFGVPDSFQEFLEWHHKKKVELKRLDPGENRAHLEDPDGAGFSDLIDTDIGFWEGKYALLFKPIRRKGEREKTLLRIAYFGEPLYEQCEAYMKWIETSAVDFTDDLPFYSDKLSTGWEDFCDPTERVRHTIPFLEEVMDQLPHEREDVRIFDAATGIGIETTELIRRRYFVATNEIENSLRAAAESFAASKGVRIPSARFSKTDWLHLEDEHDQAVYDVVLVLGNSLCHLEGIGQLEVAIEQFARLLRPGGALVCDERNFDYIQQNWEHIHADPWNNFRFNQRLPSERSMYYGDSVLGAPVDRTESGRIIFEYARVTRDGDGVISPEPDGDIGTLSMYPYEKGKMLSILRGDRSFDRVEVFCDLRSAEGIRDDADFFTYVAWKGAKKESPKPA